jgi:hypothetical protein
MRRRSSAFLSVLSALFGAALPLSVAFSQGCSGPGTGEDSDTSQAGGADASPETGKTDDPAEPTVVTRSPGAEPLPGESECKVVEVSGIPVASGRHLSVCTAIETPTNPPSGGEHWPAWARYAKYDKPVPREMYIHNLEHGGAVITYRCQEPCPELVAALEGVFDEVNDPYCATMSPPTPRLLLTPDAKIPTPIAVSTWHATYTATCLDPPSLKDFIQRFIGDGSERVCGGGADPAAIIASCESDGS